MKTALIALAIVLLAACATPKYVSEGGNVTMEGYAVTEITYDQAGKIVGKKTMVPAKSALEGFMDKIVKGLESFLDLTDVPTVSTR